MPAIQPIRLKQQATLLAQLFAEPASFTRSLHHLLEYYADRTRRPGQASKPIPLILAYRVEQPVLRRLLQELTPLAQKDPAQALKLCDALWSENYLEFRQLAINLLGQIPEQHSDGITERVKTWLSEDLDSSLATALLDQGLSHLRQEQSQEVIQIARGWLEDKSNFFKQAGLRTLTSVVGEPDFENMPIVFRLIQPLVRTAPEGLRYEVVQVLRELARRTPQETAYFLRQNLSLSESTDTPWFTRQIMREFPVETQESLRTALRSRRTR